VQIIPSIDIVEGNCVRLSEGKFESQKMYGIGAVDAAMRFFHEGAALLHVVDLEGAGAGRVTNWEAIQGICNIPGLRVQVGGGFRTDADVDRLLALGAERVVSGTLAIRSPEVIERWAKRFGPQRLCIALDTKNGAIAVDAWRGVNPIPFETAVRGMMDLGITTFLSTDVERDGTMKGPNLKWYSELVRRFPQIRWFASGGINSIESVRLLHETGVAAAVIGKALYEGGMTYEECVRSLC